MALPSVATRPPAARSESVALSESETPASPLSATGLIARVKAMLAERSDNRIAQIVAGKVLRRPDYPRLFPAHAGTSGRKEHR
jgi:hypothetical protein